MLCIILIFYKSTSFGLGETVVRIITLDEGGAEIITLLATRRKMHASIVTSDYQKVDGYIRSLAIVPRTVFDAHSAVGFVHYL